MPPLVELGSVLLQVMLDRSRRPVRKLSAAESGRVRLLNSEDSPC
jgi:hypothetical protein